MQQIISSFDKQTSTNFPSGKHTCVDWKEDVEKLVEQFQSENHVSGRYHTSFPSFPRSHFKVLNLREFKSWIAEKVENFTKMNIYQHRGIWINNDE